MSEAPERIVPSCVEALENYQQADMDGIIVLASRQAIHETIDAYWARVETCEELEAKLAKAEEVLKRQAEAWSNALELDIIAKRHRTAAFLLLEEVNATLAELTGGKDGLG